MDENAKNVEGLVEYLITSLVDDKEAVSFETIIDDDTPRITVNLRVNPNDIGHIIGKDGNVIKSVRTLARACVAKQDIKVDVELVEDE